MLHLIAYDISCGRRLRRVARICEDYGLRVEKSVFECFLSQETFCELWERLSKIIDEEDGDRIVAYPIALNEQKNIKVLGRCTAGSHQDIYIF